ncbi:hypothetical protein MEJ65_00165 [Candidatus Carsonella ruddii]|uniref:Uncharacterized protein n=1 Tax=Carsonella ruddii TaxID=114186 RepID=A0AAJ6JYF6_CARRU|nr:hypothetical protein [Candidatus Carsonella ruddii]WGS66700.1 hypothetical protein MEJ66_00165 [Candidatus Carsonella ruddii]WGS66895.1 hypothetical protein MEJ62_00160 [Candidatus Carsonella ruddii]WGS67087.1 hypothetical protein MEJ60_00160 [Candidatus Carsonella ruddii]WGS67280.1 hypothetical protein MEJ65_00165 [Candidatus Carsonella ruddii]WMC18296.1 MAG: hypothetical protein NU472_00165 [Candidatus Carsonella ruddii]
MKKIKEEFNFLKINLKKDFLIKIIYNETMLFIKNKNNINRIKENLKINFVLLCDYILSSLQSLMNYEDSLFFFVKQALIFIIVMKHLLFVIIKKIIVSIFSLKYSIIFINFKIKKDYEIKKTDILDVSSKDKFIFIKYIIKNSLHFILNIMIFFINYFI